MAKTRKTVVVVRGVLGWRGMEVTITTLPATKKSGHQITYKGTAQCGDCGEPFTSPPLQSENKVEGYMADTANAHIKAQHE